MWKRIGTTALVAIGLLALHGDAQADGTIAWDTAGDSNLPCSYGAHWIITGPADWLSSATLTVGEDSYSMEVREEDFAWIADSGPVPLNPTAFATYVGEADETNHLQLTGCIDAPAGGGGGSGPSVPAPSPAPEQAPPDSTHDVVIVCKHWTWQKARHLRLVSFSRQGVSVYRCAKV